jgi:ribosomal 50S subunit-associated protein YjgA (DUF615 family)
MDSDGIRVVLSKSEQKRELERWRERAEALLNLPQKELDALVLPEEVLHELVEGKRLDNRAARSRQISYLTRLVAQSPEDTKARIIAHFSPRAQRKKKPSI